MTDNVHKKSFLNYENEMIQQQTIEFLFVLTYTRKRFKSFTVLKELDNNFFYSFKGTQQPTFTQTICN